MSGVFFIIKRKDAWQAACLLQGTKPESQTDCLVRGKSPLFFVPSIRPYNRITLKIYIIPVTKPGDLVCRLEVKRTGPRYGHAHTEGEKKHHRM